MKRSLRAFGIGIFLVGAALTLYDEFLAPSADDQIELLEQQLEDSEKKANHLQNQLNELVPADVEAKESSKEKEAEKVTEQNADATSKDSKKQPDVQVDVITGTIFVYDNVTLYDIGKQAEDLGIIENGRELELYLYKPEYARSIQKGQFELNSNMSIEEMALMLTGKSNP